MRDGHPGSEGLALGLLPSRPAAPSRSYALSARGPTAPSACPPVFSAMAPKKEDPKKSAKSSGGGKAKKKKWSKGKVKEKLSNLVLFDKITYDKMLADVPKLKLITPSIISEKLKVRGRARARARARVGVGVG